MSWALCTSGSAINKAGINANATIVASGSALSAFSDEVDGVICSLCRMDVITNYLNFTFFGKQILGSLASSMIAQKIINYDPDAIGRGTATLRINILENDIGRAIGLLKDDKVKSYLKVT
jgi:hypothetical protein